MGQDVNEVEASKALLVEGDGGAAFRRSQMGSAVQVDLHLCRVVRACPAVGQPLGGDGEQVDPVLRVHAEGEGACAALLGRAAHQVDAVQAAQVPGRDGGEHTDDVGDAVGAVEL